MLGRACVQHWHAPWNASHKGANKAHLLEQLAEARHVASC